MKYVIACKDIGATYETCTFEAASEDRGEVLKEILEHAKAKHLEELPRGVSDEKILDIMKNYIHEEE